MTEKTKIRLVMGLFIVFLVLCLVSMLVVICEDTNAEEVLVNAYPFWAEDSTFQTVRILKCYETYPNGQRELLGYVVVVDSSGYRIHEEKSVWFLKWATQDALRLRSRLGKRQTERRLKMQDSKGNVIEPGDKLRSDQSPPGCGDVRVVDISITNIATLEWLQGSGSEGKRFPIDRKNLKNSSWVKVAHKGELKIE